MGITRCRVCEATLQVWAGSEPEELRQVCGSCATAELRRLDKERDAAVVEKHSLLVAWAELEAVLRKVALRGLDAPCAWCDYNGAGYWQAGTHANSCPWHTVGGLLERKEALKGGT